MNFQNEIAKITDSDELQKINRMCVARMRQLSEIATCNFVKGDIVEFDAKGGSWRGEVTKVNPKTVSVLAELVGNKNAMTRISKNTFTPNRQVSWKVGGSLLRKVA
jgi:hypothetical protein